MRKELEKARRELELELARIDKQLSALKPPRPAAEPVKERPRPIRAVVLDALEDLGILTYSRELSLYCRARFGREISPARFGTLGSDEINAFGGSRPRAVWLCFALTERGESIKRLWGRSDWPLEDRVVAPTTGRVQHLRMTMRLAQLALNADGMAADPTMLRILAADHARDLPGVKFRRGEFPLQEWIDKASEQLLALEPRDLELRRAAAARLAIRSEYQQLFGGLDLHELVQEKGAVR